MSTNQKYLFCVLSLLVSSQAVGMRQVANQAGSQASLALGAGAASVLGRQFSTTNVLQKGAQPLKPLHPSANNLSFLQKILARNFEAKKDEDQMKSMYRKFQLNNIPQIYKSQGPGAQMISAFSFSKPSVIFYNPDELGNDEAVIDFALLHEMGHARRGPQSMLIRLASKLLLPLSFIATTFFKVIAIKYGFLGLVLAPKLFRRCYTRFVEEPAADGFAIKHASDRNLSAWINFLKAERAGQSRLEQIIRDLDHPTPDSRIYRAQRALDGKVDLSQTMKIISMLTAVYFATKFAYDYYQNIDTIAQGLEVLTDILDRDPDNLKFDQHCDKIGVDVNGKDSYRYCLQMIQQYLEKRYQALKENEVLLVDENGMDQKIIHEIIN